MNHSKQHLESTRAQMKELIVEATSHLGQTCWDLHKKLGNAYSNAEEQQVDMIRMGRLAEAVNSLWAGFFLYEKALKEIADAL